MRVAKYALLLSLLAWAAASALATLAQDVPYERILHSQSEPQNWLTYGGSYNSQQFSLLKQINKQNVSQLKVAWIYQTSHPGTIEASPIVVDGVMYIVEPPSTVVALDVRTGLKLWSYSPKLPEHVVAIGLQVHEPRRRPPRPHRLHRHRRFAPHRARR